MSEAGGDDGRGGFDGGEFAVVPARAVLPVRSEDMIADWLRARVQDSFAAQHELKMFARARARHGESELDAAIREVARALASGSLRAVRLPKAVPLLEAPPMVDLSELAGGGNEDEPEPTSPRYPADGVPEPEPQTTWVEVEVVHESGAAYPDLPVRFVLPDGSSRTVNLDRQSRGRIDDVPRRGTCRLELPEDLGPSRQQVDARGPIEPWANDVRVSSRPDAPVGLRFEALNRIVVGRARLHVLETEEGCFGLERAVLLPDLGVEDERPRVAIPTALDVAVAAMRFVEQHPDREILVAGHTDARGSTDFNAALARERATSVYFYLAGEHDAWASHAMQHAAADDVQRVLAWIARVHPGFSCDPGPVDGDFGELSQAALDQFRSAFAAQHDQQAGGSGPASTEDWKAFAVMYDADLVRQLELTPEALGERRSTLVFFDPPVVGFGEAYARHATKTSDSARAEDRRVDLLFFDPRDLPTAKGEGLGEEVYGKTHAFVHEPVPAAPTQPRHNEITITLVDDDGRPLPDVAFSLTTPGGLPLEAEFDASGTVRLTNLSAGNCTVAFSQAG